MDRIHFEDLDEAAPDVQTLQIFDFRSPETRIRLSSCFRTSKLSESTPDFFKMILLDQEMNLKQIRSKNSDRKNIFSGRKIFLKNFKINFENFDFFDFFDEKSKFSKKKNENFQKYFSSRKNIFFRSDFFSSPSPGQGESF